MNSRLPTERSFGLGVGLTSLALAGLSWWRGHVVTAEAVAAIGAVLVTAGLIAPAALRVPNRIWWRVAQLLGWVNSRILLTLFFFAVLTPVSAFMRVIGRNPLRAPSAGTNWGAYAPRRRDAKHYEHLF